MRGNSLVQQLPQFFSFYFEDDEQNIRVSGGLDFQFGSTGWHHPSSEGVVIDCLENGSPHGENDRKVSEITFFKYYYGGKQQKNN